MLKDKETKKLSFHIGIVILLTVCLVITTYALTMVSVEVKKHVFSTGLVSVNFNDGKAVIEKDEFLFEPGMTVRKECFVENLSTEKVYYRLYADHITGDLQDYIEVTVMHDDLILYRGLMKDFLRENVSATDDYLEEKEKITLTFLFHMPEAAGNIAQSSELSFDLKVDIVQMKNNPQKEFAAE